MSHSTLLISLLAILPATASKPLQVSTATAANTTAVPSNSLLTAAQTLNQRGAELLAAGKADKALANWQQAHKIYTQIKDFQGIIGTKINQAQALQSLGFYRQALLNLQEVNTTLQQQPDSELKMQGLLGLGNSLRALRMLEQKTINTDRGMNLGAKETLIQSLKIATTLQDRAAIDRINLSLGNTLNLIGSKEQMQAAIDTYEKIAPDAAPLIRIQAQINLYRIQSQPELKTAPNTLTFLTDTRKTLDAIAPSRSTVYAYINLAETIKKNQEGNNVDREILMPVARLLTTAIEQARTIKDLRSEAQAIGSLGSLYALIGQNLEAKNLTQKALTIAENLPAPDLAYRLHWQLGKTLTANNPQAKDLETATSAYRQAINHLKLLRNDLNAIDADLQFSFRDSVEPVYREYVNLLLRDGEKISEDNLATARDLIESLQVAELENFLRQGCLGSYLYPTIDSLNRSKLEPGTGEIQDDLTDANYESLLDAAIDREEIDRRSTQQSAIQTMLAEALANLSPELQEILQLFYRDGLSQQELSSRLKLSQPTVSRRIKKAEELLLAALLTWIASQLHKFPDPNELKGISTTLREWLIDSV